MPMPCITRGQTSAPLVIRRSYDLSADLCRRGSAEEESPLGFRMHGTGEVPLMRCLVIGGGILTAVGLVCAIRKCLVAMHYRRRYARYYEARAAKKYKKKCAKTTCNNTVPKEAANAAVGNSRSN